MKLSLARYGGVGGIQKPPIVIDSEALPEATRVRLHKLVAEARLDTSPPSLEKAKPDVFGYELCVTDHDVQHTVEFSFGEATSELRALVAEIRAITRSR